MTHIPFRATALSLLVLPALLLAPAHATTASAELCSALVQIEATLSSSIPLNVLPPEVATEVAGYQRSIVEPLFASAQKTAPAAIADALATYASATIQSLTTLDFTATRTLEFAAADDVIDAKLLADCGFEPMPVTATSYEYLNIKDIMPVGETALTLNNVADQVHEISIARINDDVNMTAREVLMLGQEDALAAITLVAYAAVEPGGSETTFLNLTPGRYYAVCFTPTGSKSFSEPGDGPPHFLHGMLKEFLVQ
jgi:hypothetical protein